QSFSTYNAASRQVNVGGLAGNNNITLSISFTNNQYQLLVQDSINGGATVGQEYLLSNVDGVNVNLGAGDDTLNCVGLFDANNTFNIDSQNNASVIYAYAESGSANRCVLSSDVMASNDPPVFFYGSGSGSGNTLELDGSNLGFDQTFSVLGGQAQHYVPGNP